MQHLFFLLSLFTFSLFIVIFDCHPAPSSCLSVSKASKQTHPNGPRRSWSWGSCCGCRQPPHPHSGYSDPGSSGCWSPRCLSPLSRTAGGWGTAHPQCFLVPPWKTGRSQILFHSTGRSWTGNSVFGCLNRGVADRCGI